MTLTAVIVDDEPLARNRMQRLLKQLNVKVMALAEDGQLAIREVLEHKPDLVFMDIEMPIMNGIEAAQAILDVTDEVPIIIFCTAYDEYAIEAFNTSAIAYLLKPVMEEDIKRAISKSTQISKTKLSNLESASEHDSDVRITASGTIRKLKASELIYIRSEDKCSFAGLLDGQEVLVDYSLKSLEQKLSGQFIRVHRNALVNTHQITGLVREKDGLTRLELRSSPIRFLVSRRHLTRVKRELN